MANPAGHDTRLSELEVELKELEVKAKRREIRGPVINWTVVGSVAVAVIAGTVSLLGTAYSTYRSNLSTQATLQQQYRVEQLKAKNELIIEAVKTGIDNPQLANENLLFFLNAHLIEDPGDLIRKQVEAGKAPVLSANGGAGPARDCPYDVASLSLEDLLKLFEGKSFVPDQQALATIKAKIVSKISGVALTGRQVDAIASYVFNTGQMPERMVDLLNAGNISAAADSFLSLSPLQGIEIRRACERAMFLAG
jgi:hypothetical protein